MNPIVVLREEDGHLPALLFPGHDVADPQAVMNMAAAWLERNGADEHMIFTARNHAPVGDRVAQAWWGGFDRGFVQAHHEDAVAVTVISLPRVAIPIPEDDPEIAGPRRDTPA